MEFPIYAKHPDHSVWYALLGPKRFTELKRMGADKSPLPSKYIVTEISATDYSTALYVQDIIDSIKEGKLLEITAIEFQEIEEPYKS